MAKATTQRAKAELQIMHDCASKEQPVHTVSTRMAPELRHQLADCARPLVEAIRVPSGRHSAMMYPGAGGVRL